MRGWCVPRQSPYQWITHHLLAVSVLAIAATGTGGPAAGQVVDASVCWTRDWTSVPQTGACSRDGQSAGGPGWIHVHFGYPTGTYISSSTVRNLVVHEVAGHTADIVEHDLPLQSPATCPSGCDYTATGQSSQTLTRSWFLPAYHNGAYTVSVDVDYVGFRMTGYPPGPIAGRSSRTVTVTLANLTVSADGPPNPEVIAWWLSPSAQPIGPLRCRRTFPRWRRSVISHS